MSCSYYYDVEQRSEEWYALRLGMVTGSMVKQLLTPTGRVASNEDSRRTHLALAAERATGRGEYSHQSRDMLRGILDEPYARDLYAEHYAPVTDCGFAIYETVEGIRLGYSPDGLVGDDGLIEIKSRNQRVQIADTLAGAIPDDCMAQVQCGLLVTGRAWCDYISYAGGMPMWVHRVEPDPNWHASILAATTAAEEAIAALLLAYSEATRGMPVARYIDHFADIEV